MRNWLSIALTFLFVLSGLWANNAIKVDRNLDIPSFVGYVQDEIIVVLKEDCPRLNFQKSATGIVVTGIREFDAIATHFGVIEFKRQFPGTGDRKDALPTEIVLSRYYTVKFTSGTLDEVMEAYARNPYIDHVEPIGIHTICLTPNDPYYDDPPASFPYGQWHYWNNYGIDADLAWDIEDGDATVVVGVMDTGVRYYHADLGGSNPPGPNDNSTNGNIWVNSGEIPGNGIDDDGNGYIDDVVGYDFVASTSYCIDADCSGVDNDPADGNGHGTHVAGTIAAITNNGIMVAGVAGGFAAGSSTSPANGSKVMCLRIGWHANYGGSITGMVRMDYAAQAMNYVAGLVARGVNVAAINCSWGSSNTGGIDAAVNNLLAHDVMIIHAAGNSNSSTADYLGTKDGVMDVGATDKAGKGASFTNYGSWVEIAAPGVDILSTYHNPSDPAYDYISLLSGTSMAAPHCCGVAALLESRNPALTRTDKFNLMRNYTTPYSGTKYIGTGIVNAKLALDNVPMPCTDVNPPTVTVTSPNGGQNWTIGTAYAITWSATDDCGISQSQIKLDRGNDGTFEEVIATLTGNPGTYTWTVTSPATTNAKIQVICTDGAGRVGSDVSDAVFTISNPATPTLRVSNIVVDRYRSGSKWYGRARVTIVDQTGALVYNARVYGYFNAPNTNTQNAYTNTSGVATLTSTGTSSPPSNWCFTVTNVTKSGYTYNSSLNSMTRVCESGIVYGEAGAEIAVPISFRLDQNKPNPFNPTTEIVFAVPEKCHVTLDVFDSKGNRVITLVDSELETGEHAIRWNGTDESGARVPAGLYLYRIKAGDFMQTRQMLLMQ